MCEMVSESCLVMVLIRRSRSFTSVPYYYESVAGVPGLMLISEKWIERHIPYTPGPMAKFLEGMHKAGLT